VWVIKLGGSLAAAPQLQAWLEAIATYGGGRTVVVPGGGPFANQIRRAARRHALSDGPAHRMALLAMEQYAWMLSDLNAALAPAATPAAIATAQRRGAVALWLPMRMAADHPAVEKSWAVTSDSLAAWLAGLMGARELVLVKSVAPPVEPVTARAVCDRGVVDVRFPTYARASRARLWWAGPLGHLRLAEAMGGSGTPGTQIL
jgi:5-(aminomethyl)-3-furanmethanol phosphate kinase